MAKNLPPMRGPKMAGPKGPPKVPNMGPKVGLPPAHASLASYADHQPGGMKSAACVPMKGPKGTAP